MSNSKKLLIVDDSEDTREYCELIAGLLKMEVRQAANVDEAFQILGAGYRPSVIMLDLVMPGRDPDELVAWVRAHAALGDTRVVLASSVRDVAMVAREMGCDEALHKPFDLKKFMQSVSHAS